MCDSFESNAGESRRYRHDSVNGFDELAEHIPIEDPCRAVK